MLRLVRAWSFAVCCAGCAAPAPPGPPRLPVPSPARVATYDWVKLRTLPYKGKQDDIFFVTPELGFYGNGDGRIYKTTDGGTSWTERLHKPGTFVRALGFLDARHGFAGNIGTDYFPGVTDTTPLYETKDGGDTWAPVTAIEGPPVKGICAIDVLRVAFIHAGQLDHRTVLHAAGRVGGPAVLLASLDEGATWRSADLSASAGMILDVKFLDGRTGFLCAGSDTEVERSHALILKTSDGGATWVKKYESKRPYENTWKCAFPTHDVGYATLQSYDPDPRASARFVAKTVDAGETWSELPLTDDAQVREFGVGFLDARVGWIGGSPHGFQTTDGGTTWTPADFGKATNKIRLLKTGDGFVGYAIGVDIYKLEVGTPAPR